MKPKHRGDKPEGNRRDRRQKAAISGANVVTAGFWGAMIALLIAAACVPPAAQAETLVRGIISENTTWRRSESPYIVTADITVRGTSAAAAVLTVEPGVVVRFMPGTGLTIGYSSYKGALDARGTTAAPIVFTSNAAAPAPGDWKALCFYDATDDESTVLENCVVEYGGATYNSAVYCYHAAPTIRSSVVRLSGGHGVRLYYSTPILEANQIVQNREDGIYGDSGSGARIADNVLRDNGGSGLNLYPDSVRHTSGNSGSGNGRHGFQIRGGNVTASGVWPKQQLPYVVSGDVTVRGTSAAAAVLTIAPGVVVRFMPGTGLTIGYSSYKGALDASGTETEPIVFTSNVAAPAPGDWKALCFYDATDDESTVLENCVVEYGGATYNSSVYCYYAAPTIRNSVFRFGGGHGIRLYYSTPTLEGNAISGNALDGIYGDSGSAARITDNVLRDNGGSGLNLYPDSVRHTSGNSGSGNGRHDFQIRGGNVTASGVWAKQPLPYVVSGDVTVRGSASETVRLTVESGTEVRFASGAGLFIGSSSSKGALLAQGTAAAPIVFTSDAAAPAPGDWKAIYFGDAADDALSILEHCVVEFGGASYNANIYCYAASPVIQFNTIRNSRHAGLYLYGKGSDKAVITCNNFKDNPYGVYLAGSATTSIQRNNFLRNQTSGIHNTGSGEVNAENNWWGDDAGPGQAGDAVSGHVTAVPWLTAEADCIDLPPTNSPPFVPQTPFPANGAVRVPVMAEGAPLAVTLTWTGGDPNPWDTVVYDIYMGEGADALPLLASGIEDAEFSRSDLSEGACYFWRVVSRDDAGLETPGPIWRYTALGDAPDLTVGGVVLQPASGIEAGQQTTITAVVQNSGSGPVVDPFWVDFSIDDESIGKIKITEVLPAGGVLTVSRNWTAMVGDHVLALNADSSGQVAEESDENNTLWQPLPTVVDTTPPEVTHADPADGASRAQVERISFTLLDRFGGSVDTAAVSASVVVSDDGGGLVDGVLAAVGDRFTFTPAVAPLADGRYRVAFTAVDTAGNVRDHELIFTVDGEAPGGLTITGGVVASGLLQVRPAVNRANSGIITLTGTRDDLTSVWVNNRLRVAMGSGEWSTVLYLLEGESALEVWLQDGARNRSASVWVDLLVDSVAPAVTSLLPADGSFLKLAPTAIAVEFEEATSGLDLAASLLALHDDGQLSVAGDWAAAGDRLSYLPQGELAESSYTITLQLQDGLGNRGAPVQSRFTVDATPPPAPEVNPVVSPTPAITQVIR
ncbi:MAG: right-handed parallel beta-helix repeat-containing protein, partial [Desulfobacterales bacterium]